MVVAGKNGDVLCATFTYKSEIEEYIYDITEDTELTRKMCIRDSVKADGSATDLFLRKFNS